MYSSKTFCWLLGLGSCYTFLGLWLCHVFLELGFRIASLYFQVLDYL